MKNAVVTLNELYGVLLALILYKVASILVTEITHDLNAVKSAVIHFLMRTFYYLTKIYDLKNDGLKKYIWTILLGFDWL